MLHVPHLAIIAGTGRNTGKTRTACMIISRFKKSNLTAIKISSHFHDPQYHLRMIYRDRLFTIWEELSTTEPKDSSLMLAAGATRSFYIQAEKESTVAAFKKLIDLLPYSSPMVCESPSLAKGVMPGVLILVSGNEPDKATDKDLSWLEERNPLRITTAEIEQGKTIPVSLNEAGFYPFFSPPPC